jgi:hypothetical protein
MVAAANKILSGIETVEEATKMMKKKNLRFLAIVSVSFCGSISSFASGSGGGSFPSSFPSEPRDPMADFYARGKRQFKQKIVCKACAFPQGVKDAAIAGIVAERVKAGDFNLDERQRQDVMIFLQKRYGVTG